MRRAMHQIVDRPRVFEDPYAFRILPAETAEEVRRESTGRQRAYDVALRWFVAVRSRFAEDEFAEAVGRGVRQYVALGAGLDTFAWRNPYIDAGVRIFEVDHPATQAWKRESIAAANLPDPRSTTYVPVDFERESLSDFLARAQFRTDIPAFFSWLGVVPYLTLDAFRATLRFFESMAPGSGVALDYPLPREAVDEISRLEFDEMSARVASIGEPFRLAFMPHDLASEFRSIGWNIASDLDSAGIRRRFFPERHGSGEARGGMGRLASARTP